MSKSVGKRTRSERGTILPLTLVIVAVTSLLAVPLMGYLSTVLRHGGSLNASLDGLYTQDAATEDSVYRLAHDQSLLDQLANAGSAAYSVTVNGQTVQVTMQLNNQGSPAPASAPAPSYHGNGANPLSWTFIQPPEINLAQGRSARMTFYASNDSASPVTVSQMLDVLPPAFVYAGNQITGGFQDSQGSPFPIAAPSLIGPPFSYTGSDPFNNCVLASVNQGATQQRLQWVWPGGANNSPQLPAHSTATIAFDVTVAGLPASATYHDSPWLQTSQQQCGNLPQAGTPSSVSISYDALITADSGAHTV
ncbi:MAG: hypothetical protein HY261_10310, partial [Chloroflexi bacterium]|nr:hypothetical protein [Chloroflexota bacterium]